AVTLALNPQAARPVLPAAAPPPVRLAAQAGPGALTTGQTIQLAAAPTAYEAEAHWQQLVATYPELGGFRKVVVPAVVNARQVYRLRASAPGAHAYCSALRRRGQDCFNVI
ncbi:MAG: L,D-transpeptidase, partial [Novosphingobium sp.]